MPKRAREISARQIASIKQDGRYAVGDVAGLYLRVRGESRSWLLRVKVGGDVATSGLGSFPRGEASLTIARDRAWENRRAVPPSPRPMAKFHPAPTPLPATASTQTVSRDEAEAAYQRGDLLLKRAYVMERWAQFCTAPSPQLPDMAKLMERQGLVG